MSPIRHVLHSVPALALTLSLVACGGGGGPTAPAGPITIPDSPEGTVTTVTTALADKQPRVIWDAMPASYQNDVNEIVSSFASNMDAELYNKGFVVGQKLVNVLKTKKDFILGMQGTPLDMMGNKAELEKNWDQVVGLLETMVNSEVSTLDGLKGLDIGTFLAGTGTEVMSKAEALAALNPGPGPTPTEMFDRMRSVHVEVLETAGDTAKLRVTAGDDTDEVEMTRVDGKWVPTEIASEWDTEMARIKAQIAGMADSPEFAQQKTQGLMVMSGVESVLDQLAAAETEDEFKQAFAGLMGMMMGGGF